MFCSEKLLFKNYLKKKLKSDGKFFWHTNNLQHIYVNCITINTIMMYKLHPIDKINYDL